MKKSRTKEQGNKRNRLSHKLVIWLVIAKTKIDC